jgi:two-component system phosphate regulon sensor histidine kinase PhoR
MSLAFHWRLAIRNAFLILFAFLIFGNRRETYLFIAVSAIFIFLGAWRVRSHLVLPLARLADAIRQSPGQEDPILPIDRGTAEVREISTAVRDWSVESGMRFREQVEARARLRSVLDAMVEGVLVFDAEGRVVMSNHAVRGLLESPGEPDGKTCLDVFGNESFDVAVRSVLGGGLSVPLEFQTGTGRIVRVLPSPLVTAPDGSVEAVVAVFHDLTDLRQADRIRTDFVAKVSHEFKTPLTSIRGYAETLRSETSIESQGEFAEVIYRNARYLESLVNDLLELGRIESEPSSSVDTVDLRSIIDEIDEQVESRSLALGVDRPLIEIDCESIQLRVDRSRLSAALSNLIDNAIRYSDPGRPIRVNGRLAGSDATIEVSDSGAGIPADELGRIFERFYRVDKFRARQSGGTGLGLAIARHAVESQGGTLTVESQVGSGSTFTIRLPSHAA